MRLEARINEVLYNQACGFIKQKTGKDFLSLPFEEKRAVIYKLQKGCKCCDLCHGKYKPVPSVINEKPFALFIGRAPNETEAQLNELFPRSTQHGQCLEAYLRRLGLQEGECSFVNMAQCWSPGPTNLTQEHVKTCSFYKLMELNCMKMDNLKFVFMLGDVAIKWMYGWDAPGLQASFGKVYKDVWSGRNVYLVPLWHSSYLILKPELRKDIGKVLSEVAQLIITERNKINEQEALHV